jgi:hypothetical protein
MASRTHKPVRPRVAHASNAIPVGRQTPTAYGDAKESFMWRIDEDDQDGNWMEDKVRMVGVQRGFVHTRVDPTWASPVPTLPLSVPPPPYLHGSPASGTARVPAPLWKRRVVRRVRKYPRDQAIVSASPCLLSILLMRNSPFDNIYTPHSILPPCRLSSIAAVMSSELYRHSNSDAVLSPRGRLASCSS